MAEQFDQIPLKAVRDRLEQYFIEDDTDPITRKQIVKCLGYIVTILIRIDDNYEDGGGVYGNDDPNPL